MVEHCIQVVCGACFVNMVFQAGKLYRFNVYILTVGRIDTP